MNMIHKGEILEQAIRVSGYPLTEIAKKLNISRRHLYNLFDKINVDNDTLMRVGKIINHDFSNEIKGFDKFILEEPKVLYGAPPDKTREEVDFWKNKYIALLEEYKKLLERLNEK
jgi:DNA-binding Lrp family transcriptional regulator